MVKFSMNSNTSRIIKSVSIETTTILGWTVGSALHSIFTKKSLNKLNENESITSRIIYGSFLTVIQLLIAATTGIMICGIIKLRTRNKDTKEPTEYNSYSDANFDGSVTESTCENKLERSNETQMSLSSSYILNEENLSTKKILRDIKDENEIHDSENDENSDIIFKEMNKSYNQTTFSRNKEYPIELKIENELTTKKISHEKFKLSKKETFEKRWWGTKELLFSAVLYAIANICANTALGGGKVMLVQIIKCSELILTTILAFFIQKRKITLREVAAFSVSTAGIVLVVTSTLTGKTAPSKALIYSVLLASIGALTISLRNVIISSSSKNEKAVDTFTILSFWGMTSSLLIFTVLSLLFGKFTLNVPIAPLMISGFFHATYNFSSLAFLKLVGSPVVHAYFNLAKRAIIVLTAELINCTAPPPIQIIGSVLAIMGIHFSKKNKKKKKCINLKTIFFRSKSGDSSIVKNIDEKSNKVENKNSDKYPYAASIGISGLFIVLGWVISYTCSCIIHTNIKSTLDLRKINYNNNRFLLESYNDYFNENQIREIFKFDDWFLKYPNLLMYLSEKKPAFLSESMNRYNSISNNFIIQGKIIMTILANILKNVEHGILFGLADHENKGDAGINWSQFMVTEFFKIKIIYYCTSNRIHKNCNLNEAHEIANNLHKKPVIFITGGGNLGDLWPKYEAERKEVIEKFKDFKKLIFPQSIAMKKDGNANLDYLFENGILTIFLRDLFSFYYLEKIINKNEKWKNNARIFLTPDIVTSLVILNNDKTQNKQTKSYSTDIVWLDREDRETEQRNKTNILISYKNSSIIVDDWINYLPTRYSSGIGIGKKRFASYIRRNSINSVNGGNNNNIQPEVNFQVFSLGISLERFCKGLEFIMQGKLLITNRLHGHIFSSLLNKKQVLIDTKYNKIKNYYNTWTFSIDEEHVKFADSKENALDFAVELLEKFKGENQNEIYLLYCKK
ncbi:hypothetical protein FG386_003667 [Cryptosporidium ryanae]|uniref:uncharacterized protein n=1 Tax=Cryptosporidium ryanae TaxID=515981 RepID=UPI00351A3460|nr:hypothetical protein FG386_003667 [Cryptosporidium ryanae]